MNGLVLASGICKSFYARLQLQVLLLGDFVQAIGELHFTDVNRIVRPSRDSDPFFLLSTYIISLLVRTR